MNITSLVKVSVLLPTYNGSKFIKKAIKSVIAQSFSDWELLVLDDGSIDSVREIVLENLKKDSRIRYIHNQENKGIQKTLNIGLKNAVGIYIARIDDDDEWIDSDKLKKQVEFLDNNKEYVLVGTGAVTVDEQGCELFRYLLPQSDSHIRKKILGKNCFVHSSVLFRKDAAQIFCGYDESKIKRDIEDYDLWLKLGTIGKLYNLPTHAVNFTLRDGSISSKNKINYFKKNITLIKIYSKNYPEFASSMIKGYIRIIFYSFFSMIPSVLLKNKILKIYKENW